METTIWVVKDSQVDWLLYLTMFDHKLLRVCGGLTMKIYGDTSDKWGLIGYEIRSYTTRGIGVS